MNTEEFCKCPACSRSLVFDIRAFALRCPGCNASYNIKEFDEDLLTKQPPRNGGKDAAPDPAVRHCTNCGAGLYPGAQSFTATCPCCKSPVRGASRTAKGVMPDLVIPFAYGREEFLKIFREFCDYAPTVKDGFRRDIPPESIRPAYLPFLVYDLKASVDLAVKVRDPDKTRIRDGHYDLDLTALPELLHDLPVKISPGKYERQDSWQDEWKLIDAEPFRRAWFCGLRDKYGESSPPEVLDACKSPDFQSIKDRILNRCVRRMAGDNKPRRILSYSISVTPGSVRYVLFPVWLLTVTFQGKTYLSVMNASNRSNVLLSVPRSWFRRIVIPLGFASYGAGLFALAHIPLIAPEPPASYAWLTGGLIYLLYLPSLALMFVIWIKSYEFCCRRLFKGIFSVFLTSLAVLLAGLLMIYAFFAVYNGPNAIRWGIAICAASLMSSAILIFDWKYAKHMP